MLILASSSPRRHELLTQAGYAFTVQAAEIDETPLKHEPAAAYVQRLAIEKAQAVAAMQPEGAESVTVLAADTAVVLTGDVILGKPLDAADAGRMLRLLSGRTHAVMTGLAVVRRAAEGMRVRAHVEITQVTFNIVMPEEIEAYVATGDPLDKAGAYAIQGYAARWIPRIEGDYFNVVGLPIAQVVTMLSTPYEVADAGRRVSRRN